MPRVSGIDDACGISTHHMFLSNCVVLASHARLVAPSRAITSGEARYAAARERCLVPRRPMWPQSSPCISSSDLGRRLEVRVTSASRGKGSYVARVEAFGRECTIQRDRMN